MKAFMTHSGIVAPLDRSDVDTDAIIPKQYLKSIKRTGLGPYLFDSWRYLESGELGQDNSLRQRNDDFILNQKRYANASILLARNNFGCGSSREHAVWALMDDGFQVVIAPSFADIFSANAIKNGLLAITLPAKVVNDMFNNVAHNDGYRLSVDLPQQTVSDGHSHWSFEIDSANKQHLVEGLDEIDVTLKEAVKIHDYENNRRNQYPWLFVASDK